MISIKSVATYMTTADAAKRSGYHRSKWAALCQSRAIRGVLKEFLGPKRYRWLIPMEALDEARGLFDD